MAANGASTLQERDDQTDLGRLLRERRRELGLTQQAVATEAGLSVGFISQVEHGHTMPSLSSLVAISGALKTRVSRFISQPRGESTFTTRTERHGYGLEFGGIRYERLSTAFAGSELNSVLIQLDPGAVIEPLRHEGEELLFILEGAITVEVDSQRRVLQAADSAHFASTRRHSIRNHTTTTARFLHVCTMDVFADEE